MDPRHPDTTRQDATLPSIALNSFGSPFHGFSSCPALFGSAARDELKATSDVDLLVEFDHPVGLFDFVRPQRQLETLLHRRVDLVPRDGLKKQFREAILKEALSAG